VTARFHAVTKPSFIACARSSVPSHDRLNSVVNSRVGTATINFTAAPNTTTLPRTGAIQAAIAEGLIVL
jgi:hypothetical protein